MSDIQVENWPLQAVNNSWSAANKWTRVLKKAGAKYLSSSNASTKDTSGVAANDLWGGNADPNLDPYPSFDTTSCWWNAQLPSTLKLLMNVAPTGGSFVRGEKVTQASTLAEGELIGWDMDGANVGTTVAAGSNGVNVNTFAGAGVLNVASTAGYPPAGGFVNIPALNVTIQYTGVTATTFTGCTTLFSGAGVLATSQVVNGANGHAVILPRAAVGAVTFDGTHPITGSVSGATFTPYQLKTYVREVVVWKDTTLNSGMIFYQCVCNEDENAQRFSVLATQSSCTSTIAPGGGADASNNWFPQKSSTTIALASNGQTLPQATINVASTQNAAGYPVFPQAGVIIVTTTNGPQFVTYTGFTGTTFTGCQGGSGSMATGGAVAATSQFGSMVCLGTNVNGTNTFASWFGVTTGLGKAQLVATNETGAAGVSPDGTAWCGCGNTTTSVGFEMFGFFRMDDTEDADIDPFVFFHGSSTAFTAANSQRTATSQPLTGSINNIAPYSSSAAGSAMWRGNRRRGWLTQDPNTPATPQTGDQFMAFHINILANIANGILYSGNYGTPSNEVVSCSYAVKRTREKAWLLGIDPANKVRKGTIRWIQGLVGNTTFDTFDGKTRMVIFPWNNNGSPSLVVGPGDGVTTPSQT